MKRSFLNRDRDVTPSCGLNFSCGRGALPIEQVDRVSDFDSLHVQRMMSFSSG